MLLLDKIISTFSSSSNFGTADFENAFASICLIKTFWRKKQCHSNRSDGVIGCLDDNLGVSGCADDN